MLGSFGAKRNFIILYFLPPSLSENRFCTTKKADIYRRCKQILHFSKKLEYRSQHNVLHYEYIIARQYFSVLILFKSSEHVLKQQLSLNTGDGA